MTVPEVDRAAVDASEQVFRLPDLGEGLTEAEVVEWHVAVGDVIEVDQIVVEVETAKATVEVPCPYAGRVTELHAAAGAVHLVGRPLITVAPTGPDSSGSGNVLIGYGTGHAGAKRRRRASSHPQPAPAAATSGPAPAAVPASRTSAPASTVISPIVRRLAREAGVELASLPGSGPGGVVCRADVERSTASPGTDSGAAPGSAVDTESVGTEPDETRIPLRGVRKAIADKLSQSRREIPEATVWVDVDATGLLDARAAINAARPESPVTVLALLARISVEGLRRFPELNSRVDGDEIVQSRRVHLGIAAQTDRGLVVPVIRDADRMSAVQLGSALTESTTLAREGRLAPAGMSGGTFTLNNYGVFGVDGCTPIINHPEAAILGMGRIVDKPWVVDGQLAVRKVTQVVVAFDHRVCDGGVAGGFLRYVADCIERPALLLADL